MEEFLEAREFLSFILSFGETEQSFAPTKKRFSSHVKRVEKEKDLDRIIEYFILPNGKMHGKYTSGYEGKTPECEEEYEDGEKTLCRTFYKTGEKLSESIYVGGRKHGKFSRWYINGNLFSEAEYVNGKTEGKYRELWLNGNIHKEIDHEHGFFHGLYTTWDVNGKKEGEHVYSEGIYLYTKRLIKP